MESVRLRLVFERILTQSQKSEGLKRCWILLKPQHKTISDLASYLVDAFDLHNACPCGIFLSMEGFALPPFESTSILKDKDIIRVKKKDVSSEIIKIGDVQNSLEVVEIVDNQPVNSGMNLLANEEFENESGGSESESEGDKCEQIEDPLSVEKSLDTTTVTKKRKASAEIQSSKRKKKKHSRAENRAIVSRDVENGIYTEQNGTLSIAQVGEGSNKNSEAVLTTKASCRPEGNGNRNIDPTLVPGGAKKFPSRSARRKKAKRKWLREQINAKKEEQCQGQSPNEINQKKTEKNNCKVTKGSPEKKMDKISEVPLKEKDKLYEDHQLADRDSDPEDDIVPIMIRPGHIRFQSASKVGASQDLQQNNQAPMENFNWNGMSKKKGQKWGKEKVTPCKWNDSRNITQEWSKKPTIEEKTVGYADIKFDVLPVYTGLPKEGDVIAYRLIELSSTWTPELSSYRVGKISWYDLESNRMKLVPIPEYPILDKKIVDETSSALYETSLYGDDGSLETTFSSLLEVRIVIHGNQNSEKSVADGINVVPVRDQGAGTSFRSNANGGVDPWEEISHALSEKKAKLSQEDNWGKSESSGKRSWSYRALRGSALGPTMALLRAENGL